MKVGSLCFALISILLFSPNLIKAEEAKIRNFQLTDNELVQLKIPESWKSEIKKPKDDTSLTITLTPQNIPPFKVLITYIWAINPKVIDPVELKRKTEKVSEKIRKQSVEDKILVQELKGPSVTGYYFSATDKSPKPDEYKYMTQGMFRLDKLLVTFTIINK